MNRYPNVYSEITAFRLVAGAFPLASRPDCLSSIPKRPCADQDALLAFCRSYTNSEDGSRVCIVAFELPYSVCLSACVSLSGPPLRMELSFGVSEQAPFRPPSNTWAKSSVLDSRRDLCPNPATFVAGET